MRNIFFILITMRKNTFFNFQPEVLEQESPKSHFKYEYFGTRTNFLGFSFLELSWVTESGLNSFSDSLHRIFMLFNKYNNFFLVSKC